MNISRDNYESLFLDFLEGRLDALQEEQLLAFLKFNPDLQQELEGMELMLLEPEQVSYKDKAGLRKSIPSEEQAMIPDKFETLCISSIEKQISEEQEAELQKELLDDPGKRQIYMLYQASILKPDTSISFPGKAGLKRRFLDLPAFRLSISAIAAAALILFALSWFFRNNQDNEVITDNISLQEKSEQAPAKESGSNDQSLRDNYEPERTPETKLSEEQTKKLTVHKAVEKHTEKSNDNGFQEIVQHEEVWMAKLEPMNMGGLQHPDMEMKPVLVIHQSRSVLDDYPTIGELALSRILKRNPDKKEGRKFSLWNLADNSVERINDLSEEDYSLEKKVNEQGKTRRFTFESPVFGISAPMRSSDQPE